MSRRLSYVLCGLAVAAGALPACGSGSWDGDGVPVPTGPPGPKLQGRVVAFAEVAHTVFTVAAGGGEPTISVVTTDAVSAAISPDGHTLARVTLNGGIVLRDLDTGQERALTLADGGTRIGAGPGCLTWAPDGKRLATNARDRRTLYAVTLDGAATRVDAVKTERYYQSTGNSLVPLPGLAPQPEPTGPSFDVSSELACGRWLDSGRLVFDRVATMPSTVTVVEGKAPEPVPADMTTVATVTTRPAVLADSSKQWEILDACAGRLITRPAGRETHKRYLVAAAALTGKDLAAAATPAAGQLTPGAGGTFGAAFIPGSCDILMIAQAENGALHPARRRDADTGIVRELAPVFDDDRLPPLADQRAITWASGGDPTLYANTGGEYAGHLLQLHDLNTGARTDLRLPQNGPRADQILGWLP